VKFFSGATAPSRPGSLCCRG